MDTYIAPRYAPNCLFEFESIVNLRISKGNLLMRREILNALPAP